MNLVVTLNEPLQAVPYLSVVPQGGTRSRSTSVPPAPTTYAGSFTVDANTPSGLANALFSARDLVGNRGTEINAGATLRIDTEGPSLSSIVINPSSPIRNDAAPVVQANFTFSKLPKSGTSPTVSYLLSGPVRSVVSVGPSRRSDRWSGKPASPCRATLVSPRPKC